MTGEQPKPPFAARLPDGEASLTDAEAAAYRAWLDRRAAELLPWPNPTEPWLGGAALALAGGGLSVLLGAVSTRHGGLITVELLVAYIVGAYAAGSRTARYRRRWYKARQDDVDTLHRGHRFVLDEDGVSVVSDAARSWTGWPAFREAHVAGGLLLLRVGRVESAVAIPLRAFAGPAEADAAVAYAKGRVVLPAAGPGG